MVLTLPCPLGRMGWVPAWGLVGRVPCGAEGGQGVMAVRVGISGPFLGSTAPPHCLVALFCQDLD